MLRPAPLLLAALLALVVPICASAQSQNLPDLGGVADSTLSPQAERRMGESIMADIRRDPAFVEDPEITAYLDALGDKLANAPPGRSRILSFVRKNRHGDGHCPASDLSEGT